MRKITAGLIIMVLVFGISKYLLFTKNENYEPPKVVISHERAKIGRVIDRQDGYDAKGTVVSAEKDVTVNNGIAYYTFEMTVPDGLSGKELECELRCALYDIYESQKYAFCPVLVRIWDNHHHLATGTIGPDSLGQSPKARYKADELRLNLVYIR